MDKGATLDVTMSPSKPVSVCFLTEHSLLSGLHDLLQPDLSLANEWWVGEILSVTRGFVMMFGQSSQRSGLCSPPSVQVLDLFVSKQMSFTSSSGRSHQEQAHSSPKKQLRFIPSLLCSDLLCSSWCCSELSYKTYTMSDLLGNLVASLVRDWNAFFKPPSLFLVGILLNWAQT